VFDEMYELLPKTPKALSVPKF